METMITEDINELEQVKELVRTGNFGEAKPRLYALAAKYPEDATIKQIVTYVNNPQPTQQVNYQPPQQPYYAPPPQPYYPAFQPPTKSSSWGWLKNKLGPAPIWGWLIIGFVVLAIIGSISNAVKGGSSTTSATATPNFGKAAVAVAATSTVAPKDTLLPTQTPAPTATALPTATPDIEATQTAAVIATQVAETAQAVKAEQAAATKTAQDAEIAARATASAQEAAALAAKLDKYKKQAPDGIYGEGNGRVFVSATIRYINSIGYFSADANSRFIVFHVRVENKTNKTMPINPLYLTMVAYGGYALSINSNTFGLEQAMQATELPPNTYSEGEVAFLVTKNTVPSQLVWRSITDNVIVTIVK